MTRFWITLEQGARFVIRCIESMQGGEVFVPKIPSMNIMDLAQAIAPGCEVEQIGIRPGEKLHEALISEDEARNAVELDDMFVIKPGFAVGARESWKAGRPLPEGFSYTSEINPQQLGQDELKRLAGDALS